VFFLTTAGDKRKFYAASDLFKTFQGLFASTKKCETVGESAKMRTMSASVPIRQGRGGVVARQGPGHEAAIWVAGTLFGSIVMWVRPAVMRVPPHGRG